MSWQNILIPGVVKSEHPTLFVSPDVQQTVDRAIETSCYEQSVGREPTRSEVLKSVEIALNQLDIEPSTDHADLGELIDERNIGDVPSEFVEEMAQVIVQVAQVYESGRPGRRPVAEEVLALFNSSSSLNREQSTEKLFSSSNLNNPSSKARNVLNIAQNIVQSMTDGLDFVDNSAAGTARRLEFKIKDQKQGRKLLVQADLVDSDMVALDQQGRAVVQRRAKPDYRAVRSFLQAIAETY